MPASVATSFLYFPSFITTTPKQAGVTITLDKPFVYAPPKASTGLVLDYGTECNTFGSGSEGLGITPQTLIDHMVKDPFASRQYPGLEKCLPAGPSFTMHPIYTCAQPVTQRQLLQNCLSVYMLTQNREWW